MQNENNPIMTLDAIATGLLTRLIALVGSVIAKQWNEELKVTHILQKLKLLKLEDNFTSIYLHALIKYSVQEKNGVWHKRFFSQPAFMQLYHQYQMGKIDLSKLVFDTKKQFSCGSTEAFIQQKIEKLNKCYKEYNDYAMNPLMLRMYEKMQLMYKQNLHNTFDYQLAAHLRTFIREFESEFCVDDKPKYIVTHGKTRQYLSFSHRSHANLLFYDKNKKNGTNDKKEGYTTTSYHPIDRLVLEFLQQPKQNLLILMGEYGTGKTTFCQYLTHQLAQQHLQTPQPNSLPRLAQANNCPPVLPFYLPLRDFEGTMYSFVTVQLDRYSVTQNKWHNFLQGVSTGNYLILLDGFDEMAQEMNLEAKAHNFSKIKEMFLQKYPKAKIILSCREEYFTTYANLREVFQLDELGVRAQLAYIQPFSDEQIQQYLHQHPTTQANAAEFWEQIQQIKGASDLSTRPVLLEMVVKYLPKIVQKQPNVPIRATDLYFYCIQDELKRKRTDVNNKLLLKGKERLAILRNIAVWLYHQDKSLSFSLTKVSDLFEQHLSAHQKQDRSAIEKYLHTFLTFTFLIRDKTIGNHYRISHKSFRDYLVATYFVEEINAGIAIELSKSKLSEEVRDFMVELQPNANHLLQFVLTAKKDQLTNENKWQGSNALNLLLRLDDTALCGRDLSYLDLRNVDFGNADLTNCIFEETNLEFAVFGDLEAAWRKKGQPTFLQIKSFKNCYTEGMQLNLNKLGLQNEDIAVLQHLTELKVLYLGDNQLSDINSLAVLGQLTHLWLSNNQLSDISSLAGLGQLTHLRLDNNPISKLKAARAALQTALPNCYISM